MPDTNGAKILDGKCLRVADWLWLTGSDVIIIFTRRQRQRHRHRHQWRHQRQWLHRRRYRVLSVMLVVMMTSQWRIYVVHELGGITWHQSMSLAARTRREKKRESLNVACASSSSDGVLSGEQCDAWRELLTIPLLLLLLLLLLVPHVLIGQRAMQCACQTLRYIPITSTALYSSTSLTKTTTTVTTSVQRAIKCW